MSDETIYRLRDFMLLDLKEWEESGIVQEVEWLTAQDDAVCQSCADRNGKRFAIREMQELLLAGNYCQPRDPEDGCRCTLLAIA